MSGIREAFYPRSRSAAVSVPGTCGCSVPEELWEDVSESKRGQGKRWGSSASIQGGLFVAQPPARIAFPALSFSFPPAPVAEPGARLSPSGIALGAPGGRALGTEGFWEQKGFGNVPQVVEGELQEARLGATRCEKPESARGCPGAAGGSQGHVGWDEPQIPWQSAASQEPG